MSSSALPSSSPSPAPAAARARRGHNKLLTWGFVIALGLPMVDLALHVDPNPSPLREVVAFPALHLDGGLKHFPGELMEYLKTSMGFRGTLVRARGLIAWHGLGVSPAPEQVERGDPWLFLRGERVFEDYRRVDPLSPAALARWRAVLEARSVWLRQQGIRYLLVIPPNKETVYAEAVPPWFTRASGPSRLRQLQDALLASGTVEAIDLAAPLLAHKSEGRSYHYTDTHWNDRGAFVAYRAITERLRGWFSALAPLGPDDLTRRTVTTRGGDLARNCGLQGDLREPQEQLEVTAAVATLADGSPLTFERMDVRGRERFETRRPGAEIASAVILRDSFGEALVPFLAQHFQDAAWIWTYDFPADVIAARHPALVIEQLVERKLMVVEPENPPAVAALEKR